MVKPTRASLPASGRPRCRTRTRTALTRRARVEAAHPV